MTRPYEDLTAEERRLYGFIKLHKQVIQMIMTKKPIMAIGKIEESHKKQE